MNATHTTKKGFGGLLKEGLNCFLVSINGEKCIIILENGDRYHGKIADLNPLQGTTKMVSYSYPTSTNAKKFGHYKTGCYTISLHEGVNVPKHIAAFSTKEEAIKEAEKLSHPWNWMHLKYN
jgi:hypothetical protein